MTIIEGVVKKKDAADLQAKREKLSPQLCKRMWPQAPTDHCTQVLPAQVDLHRPRRVQRKRQEANGAELMANRTAVRLGPGDQGLALTHGQGFHAVRAQRLFGDMVPGTLAGGAAAAGNRGDDAFHGCEARAVHGHCSRVAGVFGPVETAWQNLSSALP
jgi:hypothetical protein